MDDKQDQRLPVEPLPVVQVTYYRHRRVSIKNADPAIVEQWRKAHPQK